jgi:AAA family ATPase
VVYEGHTRQFSVISVSSARITPNDAVDHLAKGFQSLSIQSNPQVWTVGWDSSVRIIENEIDPKSEAIHKVFSNNESPSRATLMFT